jgi:hypothetical protein
MTKFGDEPGCEPEKFAVDCRAKFKYVHGDALTTQRM